MSIWRLPNNPHFDRLVRPLRPKAVGEQTQPYFAFGLMIGVVSNCCAIQTMATGFNSKAGYYFLSQLGLFIIPLIIAYFMAWLTVRDCTTPDYEVIILTSLPNRHIVWGYLRAIWLRMRLLLGLQFGFGLIFIAALYYFATSNALYYTFPYQRNINASDFDNYFATTTGFLIIGYVGICLVTSTLGVWLALAIRRLGFALILTIILSSVGLVVWFTLGQSELGVFMNFPEDANITISVILLGITPFVFWLGILQLAYSAARRSIP